jgi:LysW-gamma-L-lysine carboxypeptidase
MRFDVRFPPKYTAQELFSKINSCVEKFKEQNQEVDVEINLISAAEAIETDKRTDLMKIFKNAIRKVLKRHPRLIRKTGSSDMNLIGTKVRIPIVTYGPGDSKLDHSPNEYIEIEEFLLSIEVLKKVISDILIA